MRGRRNRRGNRYGTSHLSFDAALALILGILGWLLFLLSVIQSVVTGGHASALFGYLFIVALVCGIWGLVFSILAWNAEEGTMGVKRFLVLFNFFLTASGAVLIVGSFL